MKHFQILLLYFALHCLNAADLEWWQGGNFYQIYPRSFKDSNNDGLGDLLGIASEVPYLAEIGMDGVWLSPIMDSPQADYGYDISNYRDISKEYGNLSDFDVLAQACKANNIKLILDLVPNHSSNKHEWFTKSENREPGYENYYVWHPGTFDPVTGQHIPPNNWVSVFRFSGWKWSPIRKQFYYHAFLYQQPDLNYRNRRVVQEMKDVITFWLGKGVSGYRIDAVPFMFEVEADAKGNFPNEPLTGATCTNPDDYCYTQHVYTNDRSETYDMIFQWRALMDEYAQSTDKVPRIIMTEAYTSLDNMIRFYGENGRKGSHIPFNFELISNVNTESTASDYFTRINNWLSRVPEGSQANWVLGNHDQWRMATRLGVERTDLLNILLQTLPGVAITYQGEELGLLNTHLTWEETVDPSACNTQDPVNYEKASRDGCRTPFPWDDSTNAGFNEGKTPWLPVNTDYTTMNVQAQKDASNSHLKIFIKLTKLRKQNVLRQGTHELKLINNENVIINLRSYGDDVAVVIMNFGDSSQTVNVIEAYPDKTLPAELPIYTASLLTFTEGGNQTLSSVTVAANKAVVLTNVVVT
ncbi:hypothetical protein ACKWTF_013496 [Chironomus riparius]